MRSSRQARGSIGIGKGIGTERNAVPLASVLLNIFHVISNSSHVTG
jgi:hypothetical protein